MTLVSPNTPHTWISQNEFLEKRLFRVSNMIQSQRMLYKKISHLQNVNWRKALFQFAMELLYKWPYVIPCLIQGFLKIRSYRKRLLKSSKKIQSQKWLLIKIAIDQKQTGKRLFLNLLMSLDVNDSTVTQYP